MSKCRDFANATLRSALLAFICIAATLFVSTAAQASCSDRPGTPVMRTPHWISATIIRLEWINKATETVWWDLEISDGFGHTLSSQPGIQPIGTRFDQVLSMDLRSATPQPAQRCYRLKARDEPGTGGCVSTLPSGQVCASDAIAPDVRIRVGDRITLESFNHVDRFVRHQFGLGELTQINQANLSDRQDATFIVRRALNRATRGMPGHPNLLNEAVSLESVNFPTFFLRHQDFRLKLAQNDNSPLFEDDASFYPVDPLTRFGFSHSFEATKIPGSFIRHRDFHLRLDPNDSSDLFRQDATFFVIPGLDR
jgi:hypothetical protein